jgi:vacuolar iron transporter family protein
MNNFINKCRLSQTKFSFGATSGIITNLGLIVGFDKLANPKLGIIAGILVIALADNISDSAGIHIYQEAECLSSKEVWVSTISNFLARLFVSLSFILLIAVLPLKLAVAISIAWGLLLLSFMSYSIAKVRKVSPYEAIFEHLAIAVFVIVASSLVSSWIIARY